MMAANDKTVPADDSHLFSHNSPGQLQELACVIASVSIWHHKFKEYRQKSDFLLYTYTRLARENAHLTHIAPLPTVLRQMIDRCIKIVECSIEEWCNFHYSCIFSHQKKNTNFAYELITFISWCADGTINRKQTARNLMECSVLSKIEKYQIACINCLVDDVKKLWPTTTDLQHPLIEYWNYRMSGEQGSMEVDPECSCVEASLLKNKSADTWPAFEYLWGFLTDDEQVQKVVSMPYSRDRKFLKYALYLLNESQLRRAMSSGGDIFGSLCHEKDEWVINFWNRVKNMVTGDVFFSIIRQVCWNFDNRAPRLVFEIWSRASDVVRNHVLVNYLQEVLRMLRPCDVYSENGMCKDVRLLIEILSKARNVETKEIFWRENWTNIIVGVSPKYLQQIMTLCLESDDEVASFKKVFLSNYSFVGSYFLKVVARGHFKELDEFLRFSSDDPDLIFNLRIIIMNSEEVLEFFVRHPAAPETLDSFDMFLRETFPDADQLNEYKRNLILGEKSINLLKNAIKNGLLFHFSRFIDHMFSSLPELLVLAKNSLLESSRDILISTELKRAYEPSWTDFMKWCLRDDDDAVENFKLLLPVNQIFKAMFEKSVQIWRREREAMVTMSCYIPSGYDMMCGQVMDIFLEWIFPSQEAIYNFKRNELREFRNSELLRSLVRSNDKFLIKKSLDWFRHTSPVMKMKASWVPRSYVSLR